MPNGFLDFSGLQYLWDKITDLLILKSERSVAGGVASLDSTARVPTGQLPTTPISKGGTGATTAAAALHSLINSTTTLSSSGLASGDFLGVDDISAGTGKKISITNLLSYLSTHSGGAQIQVGSYTGTNTYGQSNPSSLTFSFAPKLVWIYGAGNIKYYYDFDKSQYADLTVLDVTMLTTTYQEELGFFAVSAGNNWGKKSSDGKTITWYNTSSAQKQINDKRTYRWIAFG